MEVRNVNDLIAYINSEICKLGDTEKDILAVEWWNTGLKEIDKAVKERDIHRILVLRDIYAPKDGAEQGFSARAIRCDIYKAKHGDYSNHGISERFSEVLILHPEGNYEVDLTNPPKNLCKVVTWELWGKEHKHVEPVERPTGCGWMSGGTLIDSSDARFGEISSYPLSLHDRQETQKEYDTYSR